MTRRYLVVYESGAENLSGFAPDVPGCASTGSSVEELRRNLREALEFHLDGLVMDGDAIPAAKTHVVEVPEQGYAEWLDVALPTREAISA